MRFLKQPLPRFKVYHDNKTGRYLATFHATWDPKNNNAFVVGSMSQPRQVSETLRCRLRLSPLRIECHYLLLVERHLRRG